MKDADRNPYDAPHESSKQVSPTSALESRITTSWEPTFDDYFRAWRYHTRIRTVIIIAVLVFAALVVWFATRNLIVPAIVALYIAVRPLYMRFRLKRFWERTPSVNRESITFELDEKGFHSRDDEGRPCVTHWDKFMKYRESKGYFLLYFSPVLYLSLPKRVMTPEDQEAIRALLTKNIGQSRRA